MNLSFNRIYNYIRRKLYLKSKRWVTIQYLGMCLIHSNIFNVEWQFIYLKNLRVFEVTYVNMKTARDTPLSFLNLRRSCEEVEKIGDGSHKPHNVYIIVESLVLPLYT